MKFTAILLSACLCLIAPSFISTKKTAENPPALAGKVTDEITREPLFGAAVQVFLEGKTIAGIFTNIDGEFRIDSLAPGSYSVEVNAIGFENRRFMDVLVEKNKTMWLDVILKSGVQLIEADVPKAVRTLRNGNPAMKMGFGDRQPFPVLPADTTKPNI